MRGVAFIPAMESSLFDWSTWRAGTLHDLGVWFRNGSVMLPEAKGIVRSYAVGWCNAARIPCRPKVQHVAVMFVRPDGELFWTHLRQNEFAAVFVDAGCVSASLFYRRMTWRRAA